jgi:uncharacterized OsmC-like protein
MMSTVIKAAAKSNGIDVEALKEFVAEVAANPAAGAATFAVETKWEGGTRTRARPMPIVLGDKTLQRNFVIDADEPPELLGADSAANPQELLLAALNACVGATYVANAAAMGVELKSLTIRTKGTLDLRGFLAIDAKVNPGYDVVEYEVLIGSPAPAAEVEKLHQHVQKTSPNYHNFIRPVGLKTKLTRI